MVSLDLIVYLTAGLSMLSFIGIIVFWLKITRFMKGKKGASLEDVMSTLLKENKELGNEHSALAERIVALESRADVAFSKKSLVRFDAFSDTGAKQSFAFALLNDKNDGYILSSLYSRERTSVFAKDVQGGKCSVELSDEEQKVLAQALNV